jgi:hypothetical protein
MRKIHQNRCDEEEYDPFTEWTKHCNKTGAETPLEKEINDGISSLTQWVKRHSIPLAFVSSLLFFGSLQIADSSQRSNAKYTTLEVIQIQSLLTANNALVIGVGALSAWFCVRNTGGK